MSFTNENNRKHSSPLAEPCGSSRRRFLKVAGAVALGGCGAGAAVQGLAAAECASTAPQGDDPNRTEQGSQRLPLEQLREWESLRYGMFLCFGMSTYVQKEFPDGKDPAATYAPDRLDVDQWVSVARDAGMKYIVLTTKHVAGHCLWPSKHTDYTVANSANKTDVVEAFVKACQKRGVLPGLYYCSWDTHNGFGSRTYNDVMKETKEQREKGLPCYTTSLYHNFQTAQVTELLTQYGPVAETWIDIPSLLGRGYRTFLYQHIARLQPQTAVMMNNGICDGSKYDVENAWPSDLIAMERNVPPGAGHLKWREIEGKRYYMPGEVCDPIGKDWFWVADDKPRPDEALLKQFETCRAGGASLLLSVPPDKRGLIPDETVAALMRLRKSANI